MTTKESDERGTKKTPASLLKDARALGRYRFRSSRSGQSSEGYLRRKL